MRACDGRERQLFHFGRTLSHHHSVGHTILGWTKVITSQGHCTLRCLCAGNVYVCMVASLVCFSLWRMNTSAQWLINMSISYTDKCGEDVCIQCLLDVWVSVGFTGRRHFVYSMSTPEQHNMSIKLFTYTRRSRTNGAYILRLSLGKVVEDFVWLCVFFGLHKIIYRTVCLDGELGAEPRILWGLLLRCAVYVRRLILYYFIYVTSSSI